MTPRGGFASSQPGLPGLGENLAPPFQGGAAAPRGSLPVVLPDSSENHQRLLLAARAPRAYHGRSGSPTGKSAEGFRALATTLLLLTACLVHGAAPPASAGRGAPAASERLRLLIETDIGGDPDDEQ